MLILYAFVLALLGIYSYALVDPNITLINAQVWTDFRNTMVQLGYHNRQASTVIYVLLVAALVGFHVYMTKHHKKFHAMKLALTAAGICLLAYPMFSHDLFNYIFDARIFTYYHQNPYTHSALDFPDDQMTRFMHWTHRNYLYGPSFLAITVIPSFLAFGKFILSFVFFKALFVGSYLAAVYYLNKWNKEWAVFFATQPLIIIDGLVNAHNDILAVSLGLIGLYYVFHNAGMKGRVLIVVSGLIKYTTLPLLIMKKDKNDVATRIGFLGIAAVMVNLTFFRTVQPWYFIVPFALLPYWYGVIRKFYFFYAFVVLSYVCFTATGVWIDEFMYGIILIPLAVNIAFHALTVRRRK